MKRIKQHGLTFAEWEARYVKRDASGKLLDLIYDQEVMGYEEMPDALERSNAQVEGRHIAQRIEERAPREEPIASSSDHAQREAQS